MDKETVDRMIKAGLEGAPVVQGPQEMIEMPNGEGGTVQVPIGVAQVRILDGIYQRLTEVQLRLDAIHHHSAHGSGATSRGLCLLCQAQKQAAEAIQKKIDDGTLLDEDTDVIQLQVPTEESQETSSDDSPGAV